MNTVIKNETLRVEIDPFGAQLMELSSVLSGRQYLWDGDERYWADRALTLFPYVGRLYDGKYKTGGSIYTLPIHGIAPTSEFIVEQQDESMVCLLLKSSKETKQVYPFDFEFRVCFSLNGNCLETSYVVKNTGNKVLPFGLGGHPGFRLPFEENRCFEDYCLCFGEGCEPDRVGFTESRFLSGCDERFLLEDGHFIPLKHELFDKDAIVLKNMASSVSLCAKDGKCVITVSYPNMPYLGIWHMPHTDAPYVCIEPWLSLPSRQNVIEDLYCKSDLIRLSVGESYTNAWSISISEE